MPCKDRATQREFQRNWMQARRQRALQYLGGICVQCGATEDLEIDHIDPAKKEHHISGRLSYRWEITVVELDKCQVLCHDCHVEKSRTDGSRTKNILRGERVGSSKLTEDNVCVIKRLLREGYTQRKIAARFGVHRVTIGDIARGRTWSHI